MQAPERRPGRSHVRAASVLAGPVCTVATVAALVTSAIVTDRQERMLTARTGEVRLVVQTAVAAIPQTLSAQGDVRRTGFSVAA